MTRRNSLNWRTICTDSTHQRFIFSQIIANLTSAESHGPGGDGNKTFTCDQIQKRFFWRYVCDLMFVANFLAPTDTSHWNDLFYDVKCKIGNLIMYLQNKEMLLINANRPVIRIGYRWRDSDRLLYNSYIMLNTKIKTEHYKSYFVSQLGRFILKFSLDCCCSLLPERSLIEVTSVVCQSLREGSGGWGRPVRPRWGLGDLHHLTSDDLMTSGCGQRPPAWCSSSACWSHARP